MEGTLRIFQIDNEGEACCKGSGGNCANDVEVVVIKQPVIGGVIDVINTENATDIRESFITNQNDLKLYIPDTYVDGVINGTHKVKNTGLFTTTTCAYLQFSTNSGELVYVSPLFKQG